MKNIKLVCLVLLFLTIFSSNTSFGAKRPIYKIGSYYEFVMSFDITTVRFSGKVLYDTIWNNVKYQVLRIYNEPAMGNYNQYYFYDTIANILYSRGGYTYGCLDNDMKQKVVGFDWPIGYIFNNCFDTIGGIYRRSIVNDTGTFSNIFNTGIPLRAIQRKDTTGAPVDILRLTVYSEMFGFLSFYQSAGSPFGGGWYSIELVGAIIDSVTYGSILLGIEQTSTEIPDKVTLKQNYPNPFNPTTKINFDIPIFPFSKGGQRGLFTTLKVFDLLGREVATLVNEQLAPGTYSVDFDGSIITSGVYFYRLTAGEFSDTKRMMLIK